MIGTRTTALSPVPMHSWKTHFGIQSCTGSGAPGGGSFSAGQSLSYVRVTYLTKSSTVTATNGESVPTPVFPTTNGVESTIRHGMSASAAISSLVSTPTGFLNTSQTAIANDTASDQLVFDAAGESMFEQGFPIPFCCYLSQYAVQGCHYLVFEPSAAFHQNRFIMEN